MFAPPKVRKTLLARLSAEVVRILRAPEVRKIFEHEGAEPVGNTPEEFGAVVKSEIAKWSKLIKEANIRIE